MKLPSRHWLSRSFSASVISFLVLTAGAQPLPPAVSAGATNVAPDTKPSDVMPLFNLQNMPASQVINLYCQLSGRSYLVGQTVRLETPITLRTEGPVTKGEALELLRDAFAKKQIILHNSGKKFLYVMRTGQTNNLPEIFEEAAGTPVPEAPPIINCDNMPLSSVMEIYAELVQKELPEKRPPPYLLTLHTQSPLTKKEAISLMEAAFALRGIKVEANGDRLKVSYGPAPKLSELYPK